MPGSLAHKSSLESGHGTGIILSPLFFPLFLSVTGNSSLIIEVRGTRWFRGGVRVRGSQFAGLDKNADLCGPRRKRCEARLI